MKEKPKYPAPRIVKTTFGDIHIASIEEVTDFLKKYKVKGSNPFTVTGGEKPYKVDLLCQTCTCHDAICRRRPCKHLRSSNFLLLHDML